MHLLSLVMLLAFSERLVAAGPGPEGRDEIEKSFQVRPGGVLNFDADVGNVEIITGDSDRVRVAYTLEYKVKTAQEVEELRQKLTIEMGQTDVTTTANDENNVKVVVRLADDRKDTLRQKVRLDFRIIMPRKFNLDLRTVGSAKAGDLDGTVKASTLGGSLTLGDASGPVKATSKGGSLTIGDVGGDLEARASGGSVKAGRVKGKALAVAEGGTVAMVEAAELIEATANGGSVRASISKPPRAACKITANAGSIYLQLPASAAVTVDASCSAGSIMSEFAVAGNGGDRASRLKGDINGGGPALVLRATAGSIHLRK
ncbi:MAG TPA: DUF4097 family beta strand repeat-containing protein [Chthoniobacterales bacterium]|nr:DUF4097 family beta strand repeat-containing protein [Chthoniobacterales bacterium]